MLQLEIMYKCTNDEASSNLACFSTGYQKPVPGKHRNGSTCPVFTNRTWQKMLFFQRGKTMEWSGYKIKINEKSQTS